MGNYLYLLFSFACLLFGIKLANPCTKNLKRRFLQLTFINLNSYSFQSSKSFLVGSFTKKEKFLFRFFCVLSLVGALFIIRDMGGISSLLSRSLQETRLEHVQGSDSNGSGLIGVISMICFTFSLIGSCFIAFTEKTIVFFVLSIFHISGFLTYSLSTGGRITVVLSILPILFTISVKDQLYKNLSNYSKKPFIKEIINSLSSPLIVFLIFLFIGSTTWSYLRESNSYDYIVKIRNYDILVSSSFFPRNEFGEYLSYFTLKTLGTFTNGIYSFSPFFHFYDEPPTLGIFQFSNVFTERLFDNDWHDWLKIKEKVEYTYFLAGRPLENVWGTSVREFIVDFGTVLTPLFLFLFGYFIGFSERNCFKSKILLGIYVMNLMWVSMSLFYSLFINRPFQVAYIILIVFYIAELCFPKVKTMKMAKKGFI
jgi:hypothetical protein